jgi:hypothetical protein
VSKFFLDPRTRVFVNEMSLPFSVGGKAKVVPHLHVSPLHLNHDDNVFVFRLVFIFTLFLVPHFSVRIVFIDVFC